MTGGNGYEAVRRFYETWFIGHWPKDTSITRISRTADESHVVDEIVVSFTHERNTGHSARGAPDRTKGRAAAVVGFKDGKIAYEHIYWDQASLLVQIGLLDKSKLPVTGAEQAARLLDPSLPSNTLIPKG
jgi:carboxymethylenebutenolidase